MKYFKLKEISEIKNGEQCNYSDKGIIPVYGSNGIIGYTDDLNAPENSIIIGRVGANAGSVFYSLKKHWVSDNAISVVPNVNKVNPFYLYYALFNLDLNRLVEGSAQPLINQSILNSFEISVPSLSVQTSVIEKIRVFDEKIAINNQINDNLLELAKALFHEKFSYDDEVLLSNYFLPKRGKNLLKRNVVNGYIPVVAGGLTPSAFHNKSNTESPVITISSSGANAGYTQIWGQKVWSSDSSYIDKTVTNNIYFWYLLIKSHQKQIFDSQTGSAQPHVYPRDIGNILIPKINEVVAKKVDKAVTPVFQKIFQNKDENKKLENIKSVLLDRYFD